MRSIQRLVMACTCTLLSSCQPGPDTPGGDANVYRLYFLGGQSNMDGYGYVEELPAGLRQPVQRVMIFTGHTAEDDMPNGGKGLWEPLRPGHGTGFQSDGKTNRLSDRFGPELTFGATLAALAPDQKIALVKYSRGGSGLAADIGFGSWDPDYIRNGGINQYDHALTTIRNAMAQSDIDGDGVADRLVPAGIVWMQGETDANASQETADAYQANLKRMMNLLRAALRVDDLPVVIGKITDSGMDGDGAMMNYIATVHDAQKNFVAADPCAKWVTVIDEFRHSDDHWHYDTDGYVRMGAAFADAAAELRQGCR